jgi:hypothetical protein
MHGRDEKCILILVRKPEGKRPLGRTRYIWKGNIRLGLREIGYGMVWTGAIQ